jgi:hypothetical protein
MSCVQLEFWRSVKPLVAGALRDGEYTARPAASVFLVGECSGITDEEVCRVAVRVFNSERPEDEGSVREYKPVRGIAVRSISVGDVIGVWRVLVTGFEEIRPELVCAEDPQDSELVVGGTHS